MTQNAAATATASAIWALLENTILAERVVLLDVISFTDLVFAPIIPSGDMEEFK